MTDDPHDITDHTSTPQPTVSAYLARMQQPPLSVLFCVEFLERFAFYALVSLFTLYLVEQRGFADVEAFSLYGFYLAFTYVAPLFGGLLSRHVRGQLRMAQLGAALLGLGYALLSVDGNVSLYAALCILAVGHGLFKPATPAVLANVYPRLDDRRETAFIVFFLAIQLGAFLAPLSAEAMRQQTGYHAVFILAATALGLATLLLLLFRRRLQAALVAAEPKTETPVRWAALFIMYLIWMLHTTATCAYQLNLPIFVRDHVDLRFGGYQLTTGFWLAFEPLFQLLLAPLTLLGFRFLYRQRIVLSTVAKVGMGMVLLTLPCLFMVKASLESGQFARVSPLWIVVACAASAVPNIFLLPLVLLIISQLAPRRKIGTIFGLWFFLTLLSQRAARMLAPLGQSFSIPTYYGGLAILSLLAAGLWISQVRRIEAALQLETS